jgi:hypothetical protein
MEGAPGGDWNFHLPWRNIYSPRQLIHCRIWAFGLILLYLQCFLESVALPTARDDMGFVCQSIQQGCGQGGVTEDLSLVCKSKVGGDDHRTSLMALGKDLEK